MTSRARKFRKLLGRPLPEQVLLLQAVALLGVSRLLIKLVSFRRLERFLGQRLTESAPDLPAGDLARVRSVAKAIRQVSPHTPWTSNCFPQALAAKTMLRWRGIDSTLYLGARFDESTAELAAHAWLRSGPLYLTGGDGSEHFGAIIAFS